MKYSYLLLMSTIMLLSSFSWIQVRQANACEIDDDLAGLVDGANITTNSMSCKLLQPGPHIDVTPKREKTRGDLKRYEEVKKQAEDELSRYKDYRVALSEGYQVFHPRIHQQIYHFTNWENARANIRSFDPSRPTSLLYTKDNRDNYTLIGAMYTAPRWASSEDLNSRIPISIVPWHLHKNLCSPPHGQERQMLGANPRYGLNGTITTESECVTAGGTFKPVVYNWMTHMDLFGQSDGD